MSVRGVGSRTIDRDDHDSKTASTTKPMWRNVIGPRTRRPVRGELRRPRRDPGASHQRFQALSDRIGKMSFW